jgi:hypothetical protein
MKEGAPTKFILVDAQSELDGTRADGIVGLAPSDQGDANVDLYINKLKESKVIDKAIFSMTIETEASGRKSMMYFGGYDEKHAPSSSPKTVWASLVNKLYWSVDISGVGVGSTTSSSSASYAVVDSGTSYLIAPKDDYVELLNNFMSETSSSYCGYDYTTGYQYCLCSGSIEDQPDLVI